MHSLSAMAAAAVAENRVLMTEARVIQAHVRRTHHDANEAVEQARETARQARLFIDEIIRVMPRDGLKG